ncbi:MAG: sarcosine oxidase subunit gamma [Marinibacterium sp.]|nr:sarcosine oxidase subunit gamma [Marinibacterium sp.]
MVELAALSPCAGLLPIAHGDVTLSEVDLGQITLMRPWAGRQADLAAALKDAHGLAWPAPGRATGRAGQRAIWFGLDQVVLAGPSPDPALASFGALVDQSDGWAVVRLEGEGAIAVLSRLVPIDLRPSVFKRGHTARTQLQHMPVSLSKLGDRAFVIMGARSMAQTLVEDLKTAMAGVAARG